MLHRAVGVYVLWVVATWFFEGRLGLLSRFDPFPRVVYAVVANIAIGTVLAMMAVDHPRRWRVRPVLLPIAAVVSAVVLALVVRPAARDATVIVNASAEALPTSIAEVIVCFVLLGGALRVHGASKLVAIIVADVAFSFYHLAHSAPFDRPGAIALLALPGLVIGVLVLVVRDPVLAILVQNAFAVIGLTGAVDPDVFRHSYDWAYAIAAIAAIVAAWMFVPDRRIRASRRPSSAA